MTRKPECAAFVVAGLAVALRSPLSTNFPDGDDYVAIAVGLWNGEYGEHHFFIRPPLYPLILGLMGFSGPIGATLWSKIVGVVAHSATVLLVSRSTAARFGIMRPELAAWALALNPMQLWLCTMTSTESLFIFLLFLCFDVYGRFVAKPVPARAALVGAVAGLTILCRPTAQLLALSLALSSGAYALRKRGLFSATAFVAILSAGMVLVVLPWTFRNLLRHHEFIFIADGAGLMTRIAQSDYGAELALASTKTEYDRLNTRLYREVIPQFLGCDPKESKAERDRRLLRESVAWILDNPIVALSSNTQRLMRFLWPGVSSFAYPPLTAILTTLLGVIVCIVGLQAAWKTRNSNILAMPMTLHVLFFVLLVGMCMHSRVRYRVASVDVLLVMFLGSRLSALFPARRRTQQNALRNPPPS